MNNYKTDLSIVIPVRNEKEGFVIMINILESIIKIKHEIIVVYDELGDTTIEVAKKFQKIFPNFT